MEDDSEGSGTGKGAERGDDEDAGSDAGRGAEGRSKNNVR